MIEPLEDRTLMSHTVSLTRLTFSTTAVSSNIANPISQSVAAKITSNGLPLRAATIYFVSDDAHVLGQGVSGRSGYVSLTIPNIYAGKHLMQAFFVGTTRYKASQSRGVTLTASVPTLTTTADGLEWATVVPGNGAAAVGGNTVNVNYAGFLADQNDAGTLFDTSIKPGGTPLSFVLDGGHVITGFNELVKGMKPGETRIGLLPTAIAYGATPPQGSNIPVNATLVFYVRLESISG